MTFDTALLKDILVCPKCKSQLVVDGESLVSVDPECRLRYEIRDGIPVMLVDEAQELSKDEWARIMQNNGRDSETGQEIAGAEQTGDQ